MKYTVKRRPQIRLFTGDCYRVLKNFPDRHFDAVVTSPPYNLGIKYKGKHDDTIVRADYLKWTHQWLRQVHYKLAAQGSLFLNVAGSPSSPWGPYEVLQEARKLFVLQNTIYWIKSIAVDGPCRGHVKPINSTRFINDAVEHVFHLTKEGTIQVDKLAVGVPYADKGNLDRDNRGKNGDVRCRGNAWFIPYKTIVSRDKNRPHPATFPPELAAMCFKLHGLDNIRRTLDPFSGLGSTARASRQLGLDHVGIELAEEYNEVAWQLLLDEGYTERAWQLLKET